MRPNWAQTTLQDAQDLIGDPTDTRRTQSDLEDPPLSLTTTKPFPPRHIFLVQSSDPESYGEVARNPFLESSIQEEYNSLLKKQTWDLVPFCWFNELFFHTTSVVDLGFIFFRVPTSLKIPAFLVNQNATQYTESTV
jgi:hypothetical protein